MIRALRDWQLRLGLSRQSNPNVGRGPSNEDLARERSHARATQAAQTARATQAAPGTGGQES